MATNDIHVTVSDNNVSAPLAVSGGTSLRSVSTDNGSPYYVGARAYVTQTEDGATVTVIDKDGTTTAVISNGADGVDGQDGQDGQDGYTPIKGVDYFDGEDGQDGADGFSPIASVTKSGDTATISITDANGTTTATVSDGTDGVDGQDGRDGIDGTDGADGNGIVSITKTATVGLVDTYTILFTDGTTTTFNVTNGQNGSGSVADVWVDGISVLDGDTAKIDLTGKADASDIPTAVSELTNDVGYITGYTETDPVFTASVAHGISSSDISTWNGKANVSDIPTAVSELVNDSGYITGYTETDPTVPSWAKEVTKPSYTASEIGGLIDMFYPVGSYYETSDTTFNPNTAWSGTTWVLETEGQVHVSSGTNYTVSGANLNSGRGVKDDGDESVTLDTTQIPAHTHGSKTLTGTFRAYQYTSWNSNTTGIVSQAANGNNNTPPSSGTNNGGATFTITATHEHSSVGGGQAHNNMQPYIVVNRWHRTA